MAIAALRTKLLPLLMSAVLLGLCAGLGAVISLAGSPRSLTGEISGGTVAANAVSATPPAAAQPSSIPGPAKPGSIGDRPTLVADKSAIVAAGTVLESVSPDGGTTWHQVQAPAGGAYVVIDPSDASHLLTGGASVRSSTDGGKTWTLSKAAPPAAGPYTPLLIGANDGSVWFIAHEGRLARTRDGGGTWKDVAQIPVLGNNAFMSPLVNSDQYLLATGNHLFQIDSAGAVAGQPSLTSNLEFAAVAATLGTPIVARASDGNVYLLKGQDWTPASAPERGPI